MKKLLFLSLFIGLPLVISAKKNSATNNYVEIKSNVFVSKYETTNIEYNEFLSDIGKTCSKEEFESYKPDSTLWIKSINMSSSEPWVKMYNNHPGFGNYSVVNISREAIEKYCKWKTEKYNSNLNKTYKKVEFRLPTEAEWMSFSSPYIGQRLPWNGEYPYIVKSKDQIVPLANVKIMDHTIGRNNYGFDGAMFVHSVGMYICNKLGLYDIIGNVAELTSDNKIKGGSWDNTLEESYIDLSQLLVTPDPRVGFRLVMEIIEK
jgi:formylglycine-generating enzyme required for sulfatase activity